MGILEMVLAIIGGLFLVGWVAYIVGVMIFIGIFNRALNGPKPKRRRRA